MDDHIAAARQTKGFLSAQSLVNSVGKKNTIFDPSVLIGKDVVIGKGNTFYPNVIIECRAGCKVVIGDNNIFYPGVFILGTGGLIRIGSGNEFGTGGCTIKANMSDAEIIIGDNGRYCDGVSIMGKTDLGSGSQVLGAITVQSCVLAEGGSYQESDPDKRAAVLKGYGLARGLTLQTGQVVNGSGNFATAPVEWQRDYHPKPKPVSA